MPLKKRVQELLDRRHEANKTFSTAIDKWEKDTIYADSYKQEQIKVIKQEREQSDAAFREQLKAIIAEEKAVIIGNPPEKPADYQMQISNALDFIKLAGNKLTDNQAYEILKPFQGDTETMSLFQAVVDNVAGPRGLDGRFAKTFEKTNNAIALANNFADIESAAGNLFNYEKGLESAMAAGIFNGVVDAIDHLSAKDGE